MQEVGYFPIAQRIVPRLRIVFLAVSAILCAAVLVGITQLRALNQSVEHLTATSISTFVQTEDTERSLKQLLLLLQSIGSARSQFELIRLVEDVEQQLGNLSDEASLLAANVLFPNSAKHMTEAIDEIGAGTAKILEAKRAIFLREANLMTLDSDLNASLDASRRILENMTYEASVLSGLEFQEVRDGPDVSIDQIEQRYNQNLRRAISITSISLELEAVVSTALNLHHVNDKSELSAAETMLRFKMRSVTVLISQLPKSVERTALAKEVVNIRNVLFEDSGVVHDVEMLLERRRDLDAHIIGQIAPIDKISMLSSELTAEARNQVEQSRHDLTKTTDKMTMILVLAAGLSLVALGAAMVFVVERQINRRMSRLTKAVLAIADGQRDYDVDVSGPDELGEMASALEVFKANAAELHRSNTELEKFAYVAAHDLRSPLRAIKDLAEWTLEDTENVFSDDGRQNMAMLQQRIDRLNKLLSDLLEYSRVGREAADLGEVSIGNIVRETAELLDPENAFEISFSGVCDVVRTYETPLKQILLNLIGNGIKHHDQKTGNITVSTYLKYGRVVCCVQDDGPGIDPKYHEKVFGLFQTLRPRDEVEGSGLGLAIIGKLLEHYDGAIRIQSRPEHERGTLFIFDFPEKSTEMRGENHAA